MLNIDETRLPDEILNKNLGAAETVAPLEERTNKSTNTKLLPGDTISESYIISSELNSGKQAFIYLAKKNGKTYVVKLYNNGWRPKDNLKFFLTNVEHKNIAKVIACGNYKNNYYEIYNYYHEGTLNNEGACSYVDIKEIIVPSINEGLHQLHKNKIVHCDIKPDNLFYSDDKKNVVIGDCGISGYVNENGKLLDNLRGTPEYAPRVKSLLWSASISPAFDYGSFGLVLIKCATGRSLFKGMTVEEISAFWESEITLPNAIEKRLQTLIHGLITEDEDKRWGYNEVKRWCDGEFIRPLSRNVYSELNKHKTVKPFIFGRVNNKILSVSSLNMLANAIKENWQQATHAIKYNGLINFIRQFNENIIDDVYKITNYRDLNVAVYELLCLIDEPSEIFYKGINYKTVENYLNCLSGGKDEIAKEFLFNGLFVKYLKLNKVDNDIIINLERLIKKGDATGMAEITAICFAINKTNTIDVFGSSVSNLNELAGVISTFKTQDILNLLEQDKLIAWLYKLGYEKEVREMQNL